MQLLIINFEFNAYDTRVAVAKEQRDPFSSCSALADGEPFVPQAKTHVITPQCTIAHFDRDSGRWACRQHTFWTQKNWRHNKFTPNCIYELATANYEVNTEHASVSNKKL